MGAIERQVPQVKRKNSTNCNPPDARLTAPGSLAWRSGPREVATGRAVAEGSSVTAACVGTSDTCPGVWVAATMAGGSVGVSTTSVPAGREAGAQAARITAARLRSREMRVFILFI
jgi:hypothetical protein